MVGRRVAALAVAAAMGAIPQRPTAYRYQDRYPPTSNHLDDAIDICFWDSTELKLTCVPAPPAVLREPTILLARAEHHNDNQIQTTDVHRHKQ